jgi:hypothetical protein
MDKYIDLLILFLDYEKKLVKDMKGDEGEWRKRRQVIKKHTNTTF